MATTYTLISKERRATAFVIVITFNYDGGIIIPNVEIQIPCDHFVGITNAQRKALIKTSVINRAISEKRLFDGNAAIDTLLPLITQTDLD